MRGDRSGVVSALLAAYLQLCLPPLVASELPGVTTSIREAAGDCSYVAKRGDTLWVDYKGFLSNGTAVSCYDALLLNSVVVWAHRYHVWLKLYDGGGWSSDLQSLWAVCSRGRASEQRQTTVGLGVQQCGGSQRLTVPLPAGDSRRRRGSPGYVHGRDEDCEHSGASRVRGGRD